MPKKERHLWRLSSTILLLGALLFCAVLFAQLDVVDGRRRKSPWSKTRSKKTQAAKAELKDARRRDEAAKSRGANCPMADSSSTLEALLDMVHSKRALDQPDARAAAVACSHRATYLYPDSPRAWETKASLLQEGGKLEEAAAAFGSAVRLRPDPNNLHMLGGTFLMMGAHRAQEAIVHLEKAHTLQPLSPSIASDFALANYYMGHADKAIKLWNYCTELDPQNALQYYYNMVGVHQERSEWEQAQELLSKMLKLNPLSSETYESLGVVQTTRSRYPSALDAFTRSLQLLERRQHWSEVDRVRLLQAVADTHLNQENFWAAIEPYNNALTLNAKLHRDRLGS